MTRLHPTREPSLSNVGDHPRMSHWWRLTDIKVQVENDPVPRARPRFAWNMGEVSESIGDLGTFQPHIVGAITVVKMDPTGILTTFGLFYAGAFYGVPMAVQPMKAASAAVLIEPMDPAAIAGAGLVIGAVFPDLGTRASSAALPEPCRAASQRASNLVSACPSPHSGFG